MSASNDRKRRQEAIAGGVDRRSLAQREEDKKKKKEKLQWTIGTIVVAILVAAIIIFNSNLFYTSVPAVKIGDVSYSTAQFDYYMKNQYYNFEQNYGSYAQLFGLDTSKSLKEQECSMLEGGGTWYDYFKKQTLTYMTQITALSEYAKQNNITLDSDDTANIDSQMESYASAATSGGYASTQKYLVNAYGKGCSEKLVRGELERYALALKAYNTTSDAYGKALTDTELESYYEKNKDTLDLFDYDFYLVEAEKVAAPAAATATDTTATDASATDASATDTAAASTAVTTETMAAAKVKADKIAAAVQAGTDFDKAASAQVDGATATVQTSVSGSQLTAVYGDWLKDASRKTGDVTVVESADTGYFVVKFVGRSDNHYNMQQARHILIKAVASEDGTYSDDAKATAKASAQKIYDEWNNGEKTEASFASLATQYSEDTGSASNGGLYDSIYKGEMVTAFNDYVFDPARQPGDNTLLYGESSQYAGYHVVYYVGPGDLYSNYLAKNAIVGDKLETWQNGLTANYTATEKFAIKFAVVS